MIVHFMDIRFSFARIRVQNTRRTRGSLINEKYRLRSLILRQDFMRNCILARAIIACIMIDTDHDANRQTRQINNARLLCNIPNQNAFRTRLVPLLCTHVRERKQVLY